MVIRLIAKELYHLQKKVERLVNELELHKSAPLKKQQEIKEQLRVAQAECQKVRNILDGEKSPSPFQQPISSFNPKK